MRKLFAAIFGSSKNTETVVEGAVAGLDKMFFTKEERAESSQKIADWYLKYLAATQPQNLARRLIAMVVVLMWALIILVGLTARALEMWVFEPIKEGAVPYSDYAFSVLTDVVATPFAIVMGFYFAAHMVRAYQKKD